MDGAILSLGRDHCTWGDTTIETIGSGRTAVAISVGSDPSSPSMASKGVLDQPNEDAAFARELQTKTFLAVADAHYGIEASHQLMEAIATFEFPSTMEDLSRQLSGMPQKARKSESATTLLLAVLDRSTGSGYGMSFGDSSLMRLGPEGARVINVRRADFVHLGQPGGLDPEYAHAFHFFVGRDELLLAYTDGINECHYRSPRTSIRERHFVETLESAGGHPETYARQLMGLALAGVGGQPGGQDNIALVVTSTDPEFDG